MMHIEKRVGTPKFGLWMNWFFHVKIGQIALEAEVFFYFSIEMEIDEES